MIVETAYRVNPLLRGDPERLGPYQLTGRLGSGGMGVVYLALDPAGTYVAIKLVHAQLAHDPEFRGRFRSEVERARQVPSFCTAEVLDADLDHNPPYLVVEYVDGPSLAEVVEERGPLKAAALQSLAVGVATALSGIHGAGVIHRDLKPDNVLLAPGSPKVIDFGIARAFEATSQHTRTDQMVGTVAYMAPERFSSEPGTPLTAAADVFAWGCVVSYAGTGRTPFHGDSPQATAARILTQPPHLAGLPEPLRDIVAVALSRDPADRPTARELLDLLLGDRPVPTSFAPIAPPPRRSRKNLLIAASAVLLVVAGVTATGVVLANADAGTEAPLVAASSDGGEAAGIGGPSLPAQPSPSASASASPSAAPTRPASASPAPAASRKPKTSKPVKPTPKEPTGGEPIIQDPLNQPGQWLDSEIHEQSANCYTKGVMRAGRIDRGTYQCVGPDEVIDDDFGVEVTTALQSAGSCAGIWFHWNDNGGGQVLRVCQDSFSIAADKPDSKVVYGTIPLKSRIALKKSVRVHLVVREKSAQVFRNGAYAGQVKLPAAPTGGQVRLGLSVEAVDQQPPYAVTFANVDVRSL
ncbi:serine/threonine-protein kinase [Actinoplanes sp. N902-109]|uniref:serine/threonine protein kinase n=1 Tax=Actinoplanes sp. (strain N902-109) TaxID=649831 RepID=UPI0005A15596|nr:serine/threonine-protein kinase [Actinoplanes sp. N902-109]